MTHDSSVLDPRCRCDDQDLQWVMSVLHCSLLDDWAWVVKARYKGCECLCFFDWFLYREVYYQQFLRSLERCITLSRTTDLYSCIERPLSFYFFIFNNGIIHRRLFLCQDKLSEQSMRFPFPSTPWGHVSWHPDWLLFKFGHSELHLCEEGSIGIISEFFYCVSF